MAERTGCGSYTKCDWCANKNQCDRRGHSTDTGEKKSYFPNLWEIFNEEDPEEEYE